MKAPRAWPVAACLLAALVVLLAATLVRVENERYALFLGMCRDARTGMADTACLRKTQTRSSWLWHLWYGMTE